MMPGVLYHDSLDDITGGSSGWFSFMLWHTDDKRLSSFELYYDCASLRHRTWCTSTFRRPDDIILE